MMWLIVPMIAGCARQVELDAVSARVETLEQQNLALASRMADLEAELTQLRSRDLVLEPAPVTPESEQEAANLLKEAAEAAEGERYDEARTLLSELKTRYGATRAAKAALRLEDELAIIGIDAPALSVEKWFRGDAAQASGGKVTLYVFFEVWCPHCRREMPRLSETHATFAKRGLAIVALTKMTRDTTEAEVIDFIEENHLSYPIAKEQGDGMSQAYGIRGIPAAAAVKDGKVIWRGHPAKLTPEHFERWL